jgi:hypothetical protein
MKRLDASLITPIYAKTLPDEPWPQDEVFYTLSGSGLFLCRNTRFYRSAVRARRAPTELAPQDESLVFNFPRIPVQALEQTVGFFEWAFRQRGAEAVLLLAWDDVRQRVELIAPQQEATSYRTSSGQVWAESVRYEFPHPLPEGLTIFGDCHSHCEMSAYASSMDQRDEELFNGLHVVAGRIDLEPPHWHVEAAVDGARFAVDPQHVLEGYRCRDHRFPDEWRARHSVHYAGYQPRAGTAVSRSSFGEPGDDFYDIPATPAITKHDAGAGRTTWGGKPVGRDRHLPSPAKSPPPGDDDHSEPRA